MQILKELADILEKKLVIRVTENKEELLEIANAQPEDFCNRELLREVIHEGNEVFDLKRIVAVIQDKTQETRRPPCCMLQVMAALQRKDPVADSLLSELFGVDEGIAKTLTSSMAYQWEVDSKVPLKAVGLDLALLTRRRNDAIQLMQDLFGIGGDIALSYINNVRIEST